MVQSSNPLSVAVAAMRGFWVVGKTPAALETFLSPALLWITSGPEEASTLPQTEGVGHIVVACMSVAVAPL